ncbi:alpha-1,2-fucosyltransferase [Sphingomonas sp. ASV193]|uniref:alpha-1,2-fucosyltransferase n=1 Tax=Sphingomonas sp. ASV193 TaxID=3144405 RepID=UPI0032E8A02B
MIGGLGNQMFQYAAGRALALRRGTGLLLDHSTFGSGGDAAVQRFYELDRLRIVARPAGPVERLRLIAARRPQPMLRRLGGWRPLREDSLSFDPRVIDADDQAYLMGYWQSWRYFDDRAAEIAAELAPRAPLSDRNQALLRDIRSAESIAVHVRRGDYLSAQHAVHGVIGSAWYDEALGRIPTDPETRIYVFSDDPDWCRQAFAAWGDRLTVVDWNRGDEAWQDLFLMAACRHAIIANSSFSWWAAWLGDRHHPGGRTVIAPATWFVGMASNADDRCPQTWQRL